MPQPQIQPAARSSCREGRSSLHTPPCCCFRRGLHSKGSGGERRSHVSRRHTGIELQLWMRCPRRVSSCFSCGMNSTRRCGGMHRLASKPVAVLESDMAAAGGGG